MDPRLHVPLFHCKYQLWFDQSPPIQRGRVTGSQRFTLQPLLDRTEGSFICSTAIAMDLYNDNEKINK